MLCQFAAPKGTPDLKKLSFKTKHFTIKKNFCSDACPWIYRGAYLITHGPKIEQIYDGCLTPGVPNPDIMETTRFTELTEE
jgi:hypothetical protein